MNVWCFCIDIIHSSANLVKCHIISDVSYVMCGNANETSIHVLHDCPFASCVWSFSILGRPPRGNPSISVCDWMLSLILSLDNHMFNLILMIFHAIWSTRNSLYWSSKCDLPNVVVFCTISWWQSFLLVSWALPLHHSQASTMTSWSKPSLGQLKLNTDGAWDANSLMRGMGAVIRDSAGKFVTGLSKSSPHISSPSLQKL